MDDYGKLPPQAIDLEEIILGTLMVDQDSFYEVSNILKPEMFYKDANQKIYSVIYDLIDDYKPIDMMIVSEQLKSKDMYESIGGFMYLSNICSRFTSSVNITEYALIVNQKYLAREGIRLSTELSNKCFDDSEDINDTLDFAYQSLDKLNDSTLHGRTKNFKENIQDSLDQYEKRIQDRKKGLQVYYGMGLGKVNKIFLLVPGDLTILAARPSVGKTALGLFISKSVAKDNIPVDIFSLEMTSRKITDRMILGETNIDPTLYKIGENTDWKQIENASSKIQNYPISINDEMDISINYIRSIIRKKYKKKELGLVVIDYLQLMEGSDKSNKNNEIGSITRALKKLCVKYEFPLILLSQLSREYEKRGSKKHKLSDLRDSGNIEQDADNVIFLTREIHDIEGNDLDYSNEENRKCFIDIAKHRDGALAVIQFYCNEYVNNFYEKSIYNTESYHDNNPF